MGVIEIVDENGEVMTSFELPDQEFNYLTSQPDPDTFFWELISQDMLRQKQLKND